MIREISQDEYIKHLEGSELDNFYQTPQWNKLKGEYKLVAFEDNNFVMGVAAIQLKKIIPGFYFGYISRGPITNYNNTTNLNKILNDLKIWGRKNKILFYKMDPFLPYDDYIIKLDENDYLKTVKITEKINCTIQPVYNAIIHNDDYSIKTLSKKTRQSINRNSKYLYIKYGKNELLDNFTYLTKKTEFRKGIQLRNLDYFKNILNEFPDSFIAVTYLDIKKRLEVLDTKTDEYNKLSNLLENGIVSIPVSGTLNLIYNKNSDLLYAGSDGEYGYLNHSIYTWFNSISKAFNDGCKTVNLGGIENNYYNNPNAGLNIFKSKLKSKVIKTVGEFDLPTIPLISNLFLLFYKIYKNK